MELYSFSLAALVRLQCCESAPPCFFLIDNPVMPLRDATSTMSTFAQELRDSVYNCGVYCFRCWSGLGLPWRQ
eukprot:5827507-Amphidinium_carterae.1